MTEPVLAHEADQVFAEIREIILSDREACEDACDALNEEFDPLSSLSYQTRDAQYLIWLYARIGRLYCLARAMERD